MTVLATGWTESKEEAANRWAWKRQRELRDSIVKAATPVMDAMLATISLIDEPHPADVASDLEAQYEKPQADEADWFTKPDSLNVSESLPHTNANGNLQWQDVEFDIPAIVERTQARSAELKAQIDARNAAVKSLNSQAVKNVRLGGVR